MVTGGGTVAVTTVDQGETPGTRSREVAATTSREEDAAEMTREGRQQQRLPAGRGRGEGDLLSALRSFVNQGYGGGYNGGHGGHW